MTTDVLAAYLRRLGLDGVPPPTLDTLRDLHDRHVARIPYENLAIMLGRPPSVAPEDCLVRAATVGRAGYCFHQNGAMEALLTALGYDVERRHGHVWFREEHRFDEELTHLVLVVTGLPSPDNPEGRWWVDVGLGDAFREPLPLVAGEHEQDGFRYRLEDVTPEGWTFLHDPAARSFTGLVVSSRTVDEHAVAAAHGQLSTPPSGQFTRVLVGQRRDRDGIDSLKCCRLLRIEAGAERETILTSYDEWRRALVEVLRLSLDGVDEDELRGLHARMWQAHLAWEEAGRP